MAIYSIEYIDIYAYNLTWYNHAMLQIPKTFLLDYSLTVNHKANGIV